MPSLSEIERGLDFTSRLIPLLPFFLLLSKRLRDLVGHWVSEAVTTDVRNDMNKGFKGLNDTLAETKGALSKTEKLQTRRHRSNQKEIKEIQSKIELHSVEVRTRMDNHLIDHGKETDVPRTIP